jgi:hypothetical protein
VTACEIRGGSSDTGVGFLYYFLRFSSANRHSTIDPNRLHRSTKCMISVSRPIFVLSSVLIIMI